VHAGEHASIAEGEDKSLWILVHDEKRRPRGRNPGVVIDEDSVSFEQNGLVRILDRRLSTDSIERLIADLTGLGGNVSESLTTHSRIPDGKYAGIMVESAEEHYRVQAWGRSAKFLDGMPSLGKDSWLVLAGEESMLRRELVNQLMPVHHKLAWNATKHGSRILVGCSAVFTLVSLLVPYLLPLALLSLLALGLFNARRNAIFDWARANWVEPSVRRTVLNPYQRAQEQDNNASAGDYSASVSTLKQ